MHFRFDRMGHEPFPLFIPPHPQDDYNGQIDPANNSSSGHGNGSSGTTNKLEVHTNGASPAQSPQSADSNSNAPTSSLPALVQSSRHSLLAASDSNASITPSISLIPIKQVRVVIIFIA